MRCPTDWVQKISNIWKDTMCRRSFWSNTKVIWANFKAHLEMAASGRCVNNFVLTIWKCFYYTNFTPVAKLSNLRTSLFYVANRKCAKFCSLFLTHLFFDTKSGSEKRGQDYKLVCFPSNFKMIKLHIVLIMICILHLNRQASSKPCVDFVPGIRGVDVSKIAIIW